MLGGMLIGPCAAAPPAAANRSQGNTKRVRDVMGAVLEKGEALRDAARPRRALRPSSGPSENERRDPPRKKQLGVGAFRSLVSHRHRIYPAGALALTPEAEAWLRAPLRRATGDCTMRLLIVLAFLLLASPAFGCLVFCFADGKHVFGGNNEDYVVPDTRMWFVPAEAGSHGRVYFGFANGFPQGGMNDAGLFFDGLALDRQEVPKSPDRPPFAGNLADRAMAECATVAEVIALFEKHERTMLAAAQLFFGDRTGDAAIIEGNAVIRKRGPFLVATNFRQSQTPPAAVSCERYRIATRMLGEAGEASVDVCRRVLAATHQEQ